MNTAELILETISKYTDKVFIVSGTDYPAFIRAKLKVKNPEFVVVPHEITAASAAMGYSLSGKLGVLMVHTVPGTLNALGIIANAYTSRIPLLVIAGKSPYTDKGNPASKDLRIHWTQDADQEEIVRKYVKWELEIRDPSQVPASISRAIQIALSEPQGPVYLAIPREVSIVDVNNNKQVNMDTFYPGVPDSVLEKAKKMILSSSNPVIITWRAGRKESWFNSLKTFADSAEIPVLNYVGERVNYYGKMAIDHFNLKEADLIIETEVEVPWIPRYVDTDAKIIRVDVDPSYSYIPYYEFSCDLCVQSTVDEFFGKLKIERKAEEVKEEIERQREEKARNIEKMRYMKEIHPDYLSFEVCKIGWTVFNEYDLNPKYCEFKEFNSYFGDPAFGHLGWALGSAVGYKMSTGKDVIATVGDGSFIFGVPTAFYYLEKKYPILVVIFDNKSWNAVEQAVREVYPDVKDYPGAEIDIGDLPKGIEAIGGYYEYVERPEEIEDALRRGKEKVKAGIPAIIHAKVMKT